MNLYLTYCFDPSYLEYAEKLFSSLLINSNTKILFYTIDFDYENKFSNVINKKLDCTELKNKYSISAGNKLPLLIKSEVCLHALENFDNDFCFLDADVIALKNCDLVFKNKDSIDYCPVVNKWFQNFLIYNGYGNPFQETGFDISQSLEAAYLKYLDIDINQRKDIYRLANCFVFNKKNLDFFQEWKQFCFNKEIINLLNTTAPSPVPEETLLNTLLYKYNCLNSFMSLINFAWTEDDNLYFEEYKRIKNQEEFYKGNPFWLLPHEEQKKEIYFFHGKCKNFSYDYIINNF